jgi:hypothetical protein
MVETLPMSNAAEIIERALKKSPLLLYLKLTRV